LTIQNYCGIVVTESRTAWDKFSGEGGDVVASPKNKKDFSENFEKRLDKRL
jgi:hypothetical protein